ncbi:MAG: rhodanese-like domain-containing protein, partial [Acidobacteria bacterium]|nr:rhodanese-like domain-containing protein [Acidobacteriota bacterium]
MDVQFISPHRLKELRLKGGEVELIDVRTPAEFREIHADFARNEPLESLDPARVMASRKLNANSPLYVICKTGSRGKMACEKFLAA